jgi:hypothetical protein
MRCWPATALEAVLSRGGSWSSPRHVFDHSNGPRRGAPSGGRIDAKPDEVELIKRLHRRRRRAAIDTWDTSATVQDAGMQKLPLGNGSAEKIVVKYPSDGGYSPGDTWDLYIGADSRIQEMVYHRGGPKKPSTVIAPGPTISRLDHC